MAVVMRRCRPPVDANGVVKLLELSVKIVHTKVTFSGAVIPIVFSAAK